MLNTTPRGRGFKPSLKDLSSRFLQQDIQGSAQGHCRSRLSLSSATDLMNSLEDAKAALSLALKKIEGSGLT